MAESQSGSEGATEAQAEFEIIKTADVLSIKSDVFKPEGVNWAAHTLDSDRILLSTTKARGALATAGEQHGFFRCTTDALLDFLIGINQRRWSGVVAVDTGFGIKKIYFSSGEIVFAGSSVIDDRLGEVIYRAALISLDQLTESAAQVDRDHKFGQVLLENKIFSNGDLYRSLRMQVREIVRSVFMVEHVYAELRGGRGLAPTEVVFEEGTRDVLDECYGYGCVYRDFLSRLREESRIEMIADDLQLSEGTFKGDLLRLIRENGGLRAVLDSSKLMDMYTIASIANLVNEGLCRITPVVAAERSVATSEIAPLRDKIDMYLLLLTSVRKAFAAEGKTLPVEELRKFAISLNAGGFTSLFLNSNGEISRDCVNVLFAQTRANKRRVEYYSIRIDSLIQFLLQVGGDMLSWSAASAIRGQYREMLA